MLIIGWNLKREQTNILRIKRKMSMHTTLLQLLFSTNNERCSNMDEEPTRIVQLAQQLSLNKGLKTFGENGRNAPHRQRGAILMCVHFNGS